MGYIFRNLRPIPVPPDASISHGAKSKFQVSQYSMVDGRRRRTVIGHVVTDRNDPMPKMVANLNFKMLYPKLWQYYYGEEKERIPMIHVGLYALTLGIGIKTGLYEDLVDSLGAQYANAVMDFAMYSLRFRSSTAQLFEDEMKSQMLFSKQLRSDAWYSDFFSSKLTEPALSDFRDHWIKRCASDLENKEVWLCIDGSNNDCAVDDSNLAEFEHVKSRRTTEIVSYMWAVSAKTGKPITWFVNSGGMPDNKAIEEVIAYLAASDLKVKGVILDRGFGSQRVFDLVTSKKMSYIVMLKGNVQGCESMMEKFGSVIRWSMKHVVSPEPVFGIVDQVKLFAKSPNETCVGLFFAGVSGAFRVKDFIKNVWATAEEVRAMLPMPADKLDIPSTVKPYLRLDIKDQTIVDIHFNEEKCQSMIDGQGYFAIASSEERSAREIYELYQLRDISEKQYCILKSQLSGDATRVHTDPSIHARMAVCFITSILRTEIVLKCRKIDRDTNCMIRAMDRAYLRALPNETYQGIRNLSDNVKALLGEFGITEEHVAKLADEVNKERNPYLEIRMLPRLAEAPKRGRGRKKGSKNKKTLEREARESAERTAVIAAGMPLEEKPKRGPGRPKGSKNKKTLEKERLAAEAAAKGLASGETGKRRPGRPKGSKHKKPRTPENDERQPAPESLPVEALRRARPDG